MQYFGARPNSLAGPAADPDGDRQDNAFEHSAGLVPTDPGSFFRLRVEAVPGQPGQKKLVFGPRFSDRTYVVKSCPDSPAGVYLPLGNTIVTDEGQERMVTDLEASGPMRFYRVEVTKP